MSYCVFVGEYLASVKFNDQHIPDSPFKVHIAPSTGDSRKLTVDSLQDQNLQVINHLIAPLYRVVVCILFTILSFSDQQTSSLHRRLSRSTRQPRRASRRSFRRRRRSHCSRDRQRFSKFLHHKYCGYLCEKFSSMMRCFCRSLRGAFHPSRERHALYSCSSQRKPHPRFALPSHGWKTGCGCWSREGLRRRSLQGTDW